MWLYFAVISAFLNSLSVLARRTHGSLARPVELSWWSLLFSLPLGLGLVLLQHGHLWKDSRFILPAVLASVIATYTGILTFRAYQHAEVSALTPIMNLLPVGLIITTFIISGTLPSVYGLMGILLVVAGVYYSSVHGKHTLFYPIKQLFKNKGSRAMLLVVGLWCVSTGFDKLALNHASAAFLLFTHQVIQFCLVSLYLLFNPYKHRMRHGKLVVHRWGKYLVIMAVTATGSVYFQMKAMALIANTSYVLAVKRLDILFVIMLAALFYKEHNIMRRFAGAAIALAGVVLIVVFK